MNRKQKKTIMLKVLMLLCLFIGFGVISVNAIDYNDYSIYNDWLNSSTNAGLIGSAYRNQRSISLNETISNFIIPIDLKDVSVSDIYGAGNYIRFLDDEFYTGSNRKYDLTYSFDLEDGATNSYWGNINFLDDSLIRYTIVNGGVIPINTKIYTNFTQGNDWLNIEVRRESDDFLYGSSNISITGFSYNYIMLEAYSSDSLEWTNNEIINNEYVNMYSSRFSGANAGEMNVYPVYSYVPPPATPIITEQAFSQLQGSLTSFNTTDYQTILEGNFTILTNETPVYDEAIIYVTSDVDQTITCRNAVNNVTGSEIIVGDLKANEITSLSVLTDNNNVSAGEYNIRLECKNSVVGNTIIGLSAGIGHVMRTQGDETLINYDSVALSNTINSGASYGLIGSTTFTPNGTEGNNKYVLVDYDNIINNTLGQNQAISTYVTITNGVDTVNCEPIKQYLYAGDVKTRGGLCYIKPIVDTALTISVYGTGINVNYDTDLFIKEFNYDTEEQIKRNVLTGITINSLTLEEKATTNFTTESNNAEVVIKGFISAKIDNPSVNQTETILGQIQVLDETETIIYSTQSVTMTVNGLDRSMVFQTIIPIRTGTNKFKLLLSSSNAESVTISGGEINGYIINKLDFEDNTFLIQAFEFWDNTQLGNFSAKVGDVTYTTTGTNITAIGINPYQDILISKDTYLSRLFSQHDTLTDLNASIGQHRLDVSISEIYTNNGINNFTLETDIGSFSTTNGVVTIYPFEAIYNNWNITLTEYFDKTGLEFQVGGGLTETTVTGFYDTNLTFQDNDLNPIEPVCSWLGNDLTTTYTIAQTKTSNATMTCILPGYQQTTYNLFDLVTPLNHLYTMNKSKIILYAYNRNNNNLITDNVTFELIGPNGFIGSSVTGIIEIENISFVAGDYRVVASSSNYESETGFFTYTGQELLEKKLYLMNSTEPNKGLIKIEVHTQESKAADGAIVQMLQWNPVTSAFERVSEQSTNLNGEVYFNVELNEKVYIFQATKGLLSAKSSENGELITVDGLTEVLVLSGTPGETVYFLNEVSFSITEDTTLRALNISQVDFEVSNSNGLVSKGCIFYYDVTGFNKQTWGTYDTCVESDKFIIQTDNIVLDTNRSIRLEFVLYSGTFKEVVGSINYVGDNSFSKLFDGIGFTRYIVFGILIILLGLGVTSGSVALIIGALFGNMILVTTVFPNWITGGITALLGLLTLGALYGGYGR